MSAADESIEIEPTFVRKARLYDKMMAPDTVRAVGRERWQPPYPKAEELAAKIAPMVDLPVGAEMTVEYDPEDGRLSAKFILRLSWILRGNRQVGSAMEISEYVLRDAGADFLRHCVRQTVHDALRVFCSREERS